jgi:hypothetical protein
MAIDAIPWKGHARYSRKYHHGAEAAAGHDDIGTDTIKESWKEQQQKDLGKSTGDDLDHAISLETLRRRHAERVMIIRGGLQMVADARHTFKAGHDTIALSLQDVLRNMLTDSEYPSSNSRPTEDDIIPVIYIQGDTKPARRTANTRGRHRQKEIDKILARKEEGNKLMLHRQRRVASVTSYCYVLLFANMSAVQHAQDMPDNRK